MLTKYELVQYILNCKACPYRDNIGECMNPSKPSGNIIAKYMFINTRATQESHLIDETLSLQNELMFDRILQDADIVKNECYITNLVKCNGLRGNGGPSFVANAKTCISRNLNEELDLVKPKIIVCMGFITASILFSDKSANAGSRYTLGEAEVFVIESPDTLFRKGKSHMEDAVKTLRKAKQCLNLCELATKQNER